MKSNHVKYILLTSAWNEEKNIGQTIESVINQFIKPLLWIIVNDGSTDNTENIIKSYLDNKFIKLVKIPGEKKHNFGSKVHALNHAKNIVKNEKYDYIGILDADLSFGPDYFEKLFKKFNKNSKLGICGGIIFESINGKEFEHDYSHDSVAGGVQMFRAQCFNDVGDFLPMEHGGEDAVVEIKAKMNSWEIQTYSDLKVLHHGYIGGGSGNLIKGKFRRGICFYQLGYLPLFQVLRCIHRAKNKPVLIGSIIELIGFFFCYIKREKRMLPVDQVNFLREEQKNRLKNLFRK